MMTDEIRLLIKHEGFIDGDVATKRNASMLIQAGYAQWRTMWQDITETVNHIRLEREHVKEEIATAAGQTCWLKFARLPSEEIEALHNAEGDPFKRRILADLLRTKRKRSRRRD